MQINEQRARIKKAMKEDQNKNSQGKDKFQNYYTGL